MTFGGYGSEHPTDARANSDLRNAATSEEAYFATYQVYVSEGIVGPGTAISLPGLTVSDTVEIDIVPIPDGYEGWAWSYNGTKQFHWDSTNGGMQSDAGISFSPA